MPLRQLLLPQGAGVLAQQAPLFCIPPSSYPLCCIIGIGNTCTPATTAHELAATLYPVQAGSGLRYVSKLDAFEEFSVRAKLPALSLTRVAGGGGGGGASGGDNGSAALPQSQSQRAAQQQAASPGLSEAGASGTSQQQLDSQQGQQLPKLLVIDDLPHAANPEQRQRLAAALGDLARTSRYPLVVVATETSGKAQQEKGLSGGSYQGLHQVGAGGSGGRQVDRWVS